MSRAPPLRGSSRDRLLLALLAVMTVIGIYLCYRLAVPFLPAFTWAVALAVVARPIHDWIERRIPNRSVAAGLTVLFVSLIVLLPLILAGQQLTQEAVAIVDRLKAGGVESAWEALMARSGIFAGIFEWIDRESSIRGQLEGLSELILAGTKAAWSLSVGIVAGGLITLFFLFYFFRDHRQLIASVRGIMPLSAAEASRVLQRIDDTIHAMVFGSLGVAVIQGVVGGVMLWALGLPSPLVWATVMTVCAVLPVVGAALVWVPAALYLWVTGDTGRALILVAWGAVVISLIDNLLYPLLVKNRLRLHTVPVFVAILGGIALFGASGVVLGPVVLAITLALLGIWRDRVHMPPAPERPPGDDRGARDSLVE